MKKYIIAIIIIAGIAILFGQPKLSSFEPGEIVYLSENGHQTPFIVGKEVNGNVMLIRQEILSMPRRINRSGSYYKDSEIDKYLNEEYIKTLSAEPAVTRIDIASGPSDVEMIDRKVFLPAIFEIDGIAYLNGEPQSWWLRTAYDSRQTYMVGADGQLNSDISSNLNGIRPAFCLSGDIKVVGGEIKF